ncbi:6001_t:CDS:2 [Gigaspora rosea]|nr:6001_t:CDS:2 [Gigaspora rosea]
MDLLTEKTQSTIVDDDLSPIQFTTDDKVYYKEYMAKIKINCKDSSTAVSEVDQSQSSTVYLGGGMEGKGAYTLALEHINISLEQDLIFCFIWYFFCGV